MFAAPVDHLQVPGGQAQIDQQFGIFGIELRRRAHRSPAPCADGPSLQRHAKHMKGLGVGLVGVGRGERELAGARDVAAPPRLDRAAQDAVGFAARRAASSSSCKRFELGERLRMRRPTPASEFKPGATAACAMNDPFVARRP